MTSFKVPFMQETWRKEGPFANPLDRDGPKVYHIVAHGRKSWPEPVLVSIVFSEGETDLIIANHEAGKQHDLLALIRRQAVDKIQPPEEALIAVPH